MTVRSGSGIAAIGTGRPQRRVPPRSPHAAATWLARVVAPGAHLTSDSRAVRPGDVFFAVRGARYDGRRFIADAVARGAAAVVYDDDAAFAWPHTATVAHRAEPDLKRSAGTIAADWYRRPADELLTFGVTGTSGKTSTALWLAQALASLGEPTVMVGTLGIGFPDDLVDSGMTTPDAVMLQRRLRALVDDGATALAMEVSSIGIEEGRVADMHFDVAIFTNLTRDHLDYHGTMAAYEAAKRRLFAWPGLAHAVVNADDPAGGRMAMAAAAAGAQVIRTSASGATEAELRARKVSVDADGLAFETFGAFGVRQLRSDFIGNFNVANLLGVIGALLAVGTPIDGALTALEALRPVPGRLERVDVAPGERPGGIAAPMVLVDYAHKPDALEKALNACRPIVEARGGELIVIFGCGGDRDPGKRPIMGEIAARLADRVVVTSDNPRTESPSAILDQIVAGIGNLGFNPLSSGYTGLSLDERVRVEPDRRTAIYEAIALAQPADVVVIAGKGHESYQEVGRERLPFSDVAVATQALRRERRRAARDPEPRAC